MSQVLRIPGMYAARHVEVGATLQSLRDQPIQFMHAVADHAHMQHIPLCMRMRMRRRAETSANQSTCSGPSKLPPQLSKPPCMLLCRLLPIVRFPSSCVAATVAASALRSPPSGLSNWMAKRAEPAALPGAKRRCTTVSTSLSQPHAPELGIHGCMASCRWQRLVGHPC
jgi:hypothetical protein